MRQLKDQVAGSTKTILLTMVRDPEDPNDWTDSTVLLVIGIDAPAGQSHLATINTFERLINTPAQQQVSFTVPPSLTANLEIPGRQVSLVADLTVSSGAASYTAQASWKLRARVPDE